MSKILLSILNIKNFLWVLMVAVKLIFQKGIPLDLISILSAAIKEENNSNLIFLTQKNVYHERRMRGVVFCVAIIKIHKLFGKNIFVPYGIDLRKENFREIARIFSMNIYFYDPSTCDFDKYQIKNFLSLVANTEIIQESVQKKIIVLAVTNSALERKWVEFKKHNFVNNLYYELDYLRQKTTISDQCFIYCSEHRIEAIETCFIGETTGVKYRGLIFRNRLENEKVASYDSKCSDILQLCNLRRKSKSIKPACDIYTGYAVPRGIGFSLHKCAIRPNYLYKHVSVPHLIKNLETRHRTEYKNAKKKNYSVEFRIMALTDIIGDGDSVPDFVSLESYAQRIQVIVRDESGSDIGGIEVYRVGFGVRKHYYARSLAYENTARSTGGQTFAILEYINAFCTEGDVFNFLGSREKSIAKFFRGFGATLEYDLEVIW